MKRQRRTILALLVVFVMVGAAACSDDDVADDNCQLSAGDLLVTEVMYYPKTDELEWVEIYNTTSQAQHLKKLEVYAGKVGSASRFLNREAVDIPAQSYMVVGIGKVKGDAGPSLQTDLYWDISHRLNNTDGGTVYLKCGDTEVSRVTFTPGKDNWVKAKQGTAIQLNNKLLSAATAPDATTAGTAKNWCVATKTFATGTYGSPGKANEDCAPPPKCDYKAGELLITEVMSDPNGTYRDSEWFEIYNNSGGPVTSLAGLCLKIWSTNSLDKKANYSASITTTLPMKKGTFVAVGNGTLGTERPWIDYYWSKLSLTNSGATIGLYCDTSCDKSDLNTARKKIHQVTYGDTVKFPKPTKGASKELNGKFFTGATITDLTIFEKAANWCTATKTYDTKNIDKGTPGETNGSCTSTTCSHPAKDGDLVINEIMSDSPGNEDGQKEWIEVLVKGAQVDLKGLEVIWGSDLTSSPKSSAIEGTGCMTVKAGARVLLGRKKTGTVDCSVTPDYTFKGTSITNASGNVGLRRISDKKILAQAKYSGTKGGVAHNRDESSGKWCNATTKFCTDSNKKEDGFGTPGTANISCP